MRDDLSAARGMLWGLLFSVIIWTVIIGLILLINKIGD